MTRLLHKRSDLGDGIRHVWAETVLDTDLLQSQARAAAHFGAGRTVYSAEGSSLCIRAMLYLATLRARAEGIRPVLLAGRNANRTLMTAAALLDEEIECLAELPG